MEALPCELLEYIILTSGYINSKNLCLANNKLFMIRDSIEKRNKRQHMKKYKDCLDQIKNINYKIYYVRNEHVSERDDTKYSSNVVKFKELAAEDRWNTYYKYRFRTYKKEFENIDSWYVEVIKIILKCDSITYLERVKTLGDIYGQKIYGFEITSDLLIP